MTPMSLPHRSRGDRLIVKEIGTETLLYDDATHHAWCLNRVSARIWQLCNGQNTVERIATLASTELGSAISEDLVLITLEQLHEQGLLDTNPMEAGQATTSRRDALGKIGLAAAALLPVIMAITAPPALAQSGSVGTGDAVRRVRRQPPPPQ